MNNKSAIKNMGRLLKMITPVLPIMVFSIIMGIIGNFFAIGVMIGGALLIVNVLGIHTGFSYNELTTFVLICALLRGFLRYLEQYKGHDVAFRLLALIREKAYDALRRLAPAKLADKNAGEIIATVMSDVEYIEVFFAHTIAPVVIGIIVPLGVLIFVANYWIGFAIILLFFQLCVGLLIPLYAAKKGREAGREYRKQASDMGTLFLDSLQGLKELLILGKGSERLDQIRDSNKKLNNAHSHLKNHEGLVMALANGCVMMVVATVLIVGAIRHHIGLVAGVDVLVVTIAASASFGPLIALSALSNSLMQTLAAAERLFDLMDEKAAVEDTGTYLQSECTKRNEVVYDNISFCYSQRDATVIDKLHLVIEKNAKVALVGQSGCGKSTLLHLLMRFWDVNDGEIYMQGINVKDYALDQLRADMTLVSQDTWLFNETIKENICIGKPEASDEEIEIAAKRASIHDFIMKLPNGYKTVVGEMGSKLSTGERQRLGLARAFLRNSPIVLLDEPTSSLDTLNEKQILKTIQEELEEKTVILVSHRPSATVIADKVYRMNKGCIS